MKKSLQQAINLAEETSNQCPNVVIHVFEKAGETPVVLVSGKKAMSMLADGWREYCAYYGGCRMG